VNIVDAVAWSPEGAAVRIIDQRRLPETLVHRELRTVEEVCDAIRTLAVRGAPAIGVCGAMGLAAALAPHAGESLDHVREIAEQAAARIRSSRPTAVNLPWAIDRMLARARAPFVDAAEMVSALRDEANAIRCEDREMCKRIAEHGVDLIPDGARVLTHCNAGALATSGMGTALAPVYLAAARGRHVHVYAAETRPLLQGSRLTAWELQRAGIPVTVLTDGMAAGLMRRGEIDLCIVGADRIAANGDVANKVGTYGLAVLARHHGIPFYVAAPATTFDADTATGDEIVIEQRHRDEVVRPFGIATAPDNVDVWNPAFDVTPAALVTAIVSDTGIRFTMAPSSTPA
jgi:methylthioribose-1-phosphate isomerase